MKVTDKYVFFWKEHPMCNFTKCKIRLDDPYFVAQDEDPLEFTSSEQLFMWFKAKYFKDEETAEKIYKSSSPEEARQLGRLVKNYDDSKWDGVRVYYMRKAVTYKFHQNPNLQEKLLDEKYAGKRVLLISQGSVLRGFQILLRNREHPWDDYTVSGMYHVGDDSNKKKNYGIISKVY